MLKDGRSTVMRLFSRWASWFPGLLALVAACTQPKLSELSPADFRTAVAGADWELHELAGVAAPVGSGGRRATIRFAADTARVAGFAGCNSYFGSYVVDGDILRFSAIGMTKMACEQGMSLEQQLAKALEATLRYRIADRELTLFDDGGSVAKFVRAPPP
jgi:heat shock protein HslJ